jgi:hypothetical protein
LRSSMIAAPRTLRVAVPGTGFGNTRTPIHGLTFRNSRSECDVSRQLLRMRTGKQASKSDGAKRNPGNGLPAGRRA